MPFLRFDGLHVKIDLDSEQAKHNIGLIKKYRVREKKKKGKNGEEIITRIKEIELHDA